MAGSGARTIPPIARAIAARLAECPAVAAVAVAGSRATGLADDSSDLDLYIYAAPTLPLAARRALADECADPGPREIGGDFWGPADAWRAGGLDLDLIFFAPGWMADQLDRVLVRHEPSLGYSTAFWHTIRHSTSLYDRDGWFAGLQSRAAGPYPEPLRRAIVAHNGAALRPIAYSLMHQLERAAGRGDLVAVQHRLTAILASYFDILFAVNRLPHPGEKRLVAHALASCPRLPTNFPTALDTLLAAPPGPATIPLAAALLDGLDKLLTREGLADLARPPA